MARRTTERWAFLSDTHGDMADHGALQVALDFVNNVWKPTRRIAGGDHVDLRPFRKGADESEQSEGVDDDVHAAGHFFGSYKPTDWLWGNHFMRLLKWKEAPQKWKRQYACVLEEGIRRGLPTSCVEYRYSVHKPMRYGDFLFVHGFAAGVNCVRRQIQHFHENMIMGHVHRFDQVACGTKRGFSSDCLCRLDMEYAETRLPTLEWGHGFLYGIKTSSGKLIVHRAHPVDGTWYFPTEMLEVKQK